MKEAKDYSEQCDQAFRYLAPSRDPQRTLTSLSPSDFEDFYEEGSEVPLAPYPKVKDALHQIELDDEDEYDAGEADEAALAKKSHNTMREIHPKRLQLMTKSTTWKMKQRS